MEYLLLLAHTLKSIITYVISWIKNSGLGNWSDIVTILTFILILIPLIKRWGKHTSFLLPNISCVIEENGEKISFIINIQKYSSDLFYGEFTLTIKQIGGAPQGLTVLETYPSYGPEIIRIENGYSKSYSKRFTFRRVGVVESNLEIRVSGDIGMIL